MKFRRNGVPNYIQVRTEHISVNERHLTIKYTSFFLLAFSLSVASVNPGQKTLNGKFQKQFILRAVLISVMKSLTVPLQTAGDVNQPCICAAADTPALSPGEAASVIRLTIATLQGLCSSHRILLTNGPKAQE